MNRARRYGALDNAGTPATMTGMTPSAQLLIVETLFTASHSKRVSYVLVKRKPTLEPEKSPEEEAVAFTLGLGRSQTAADAAAIFVLSRHDDDEPTLHTLREGTLLEADEVMKRPPDEETPTALLWLVAEI